MGALATTEPRAASLAQFGKYPAITRPTTDEECQALRAWAASPAPAIPPASVDQFGKHIAFMDATLPSRSTNDETGKMRVAVYRSILGGYSNEALAYMARRACQECDWFPTPKQCLALLADYTPPADERPLALKYCSDYNEAKFEEWLVDLYVGKPIGDVPDKWLRLAYNRFLLVQLADGTYRSKARYHGPFKPTWLTHPSVIR